MKIVIPEYVGTTDLSKLLGVTRQTITARKNDGVLKETSPGKYRLDESLQAYLKYVSRGRMTEKSASARSQVDIERARKLKLENEHAEKHLLDVDDVREVFGGTLIVLRQHISALPARLSPMLVGVDEVSRVNEIIEKETRLALENCYHGLTDQAIAGGYDPAYSAAGKKDAGGMG